jgi:CheY-like chemotaxis protein
VYATLTVSDTGTGMDEETLAHAFEPFFTTKEAGAGTGLGLATSYGIARRAGGSITIDSEPGRGTTVRVYLPYHAGPAAEVAAIREAAGPPRGDETILLVEDEAAVRRLAISALEGLGYAVLGASDGVDAIRVAREHRGRIDLLVTDVVMPRMGGAAVAQHLARRRPELRVLFTSGYTGDALARSDVMETGWSFLAKPYTPTVLARRVREVLDARR